MSLLISSVESVERVFGGVAEQLDEPAHVRAPRADDVAGRPQQLDVDYHLERLCRPDGAGLTVERALRVTRIGDDAVGLMHEIHCRPERSEFREDRIYGVGGNKDSFAGRVERHDFIECLYELHCGYFRCLNCFITSTNMYPDQ